MGRLRFFIFDKTKRKLILIRDHIGRLPLYYSKRNKDFILSSNLGRLVDTNKLPKEIDIRSLNLYLAFRYIPGEKTIFKIFVKSCPGPVFVTTLIPGISRSGNSGSPL